MNISRRAGILAAIGALAGALGSCTASRTGPAGPGTPPSSPAPAGATATPAATPSRTPPTPATPPDPLPRGVVNALVFGTDSRTPGSNAGNADALVLAQLSADRRRLALVSITRDSYVTYAGGGRGKVNAAYARGGAPGLSRTVSALFGGLPIHFTVQTDFTDFIALTRLLDGFRVDNKIASTVTSTVTGRVARFPRGRLTLHGADWLIYARQRKGLPRGDLDRAERHRAVLTGMLARLQQVALAGAGRFDRLAAGLWPRVRITGPISRGQLPSLIAVQRNLGTEDVTSLMVPVARYAMVGGASVNILDAARTAALGAALRAGDVRPYLRRYGAD